jgi:hypothetical protein
MADGHRRPGALNEARDDYLRVYPVTGEPAVGDVPTVNADLDLEFDAPTSGSGGVDPSDVSALRSLLAFLAPLLSPRFIGTPTLDGLPLATQAYVDAAASALGAASIAEVSALRTLLAMLAPLLSPRFIGTPTKAGVPLATTDDVAASGISILDAQVFGD